MASQARCQAPSQSPLKKQRAKMAADDALLSNRIARLIIGTGDEVLYRCSCKALKSISRLYFCRHCTKLRCPECVSHEVKHLQNLGPPILVGF